MGQLISKKRKSRSILNSKDNFFTIKIQEASPVVRASHLWSLVSGHLECLLGETIHRQWFTPIIPLTVSNHTLILQTPSEVATRWLNAHYIELIERLAQIHDKEITVFLISSTDIA